MWLTYALLSALFAAATAILAKIGIENINSNENLLSEGTDSRVRTPNILAMSRS
jgi:uncharacterized membrane protein